MRAQVHQAEDKHRGQLEICRIIMHRQPTMGSLNSELECRSEIATRFEVGQKGSCKVDCYSLHKTLGTCQVWEVFPVIYTRHYAV